MTGTLINAAAVVAASIIGVFIGKRMPDRVRLTAMDGLGLVTSVLEKRWRRASPALGRK